MFVLILTHAVFKLYLILMLMYLPWILPVIFLKPNELLRRYFTSDLNVKNKVVICVMTYLCTDETILLSGMGKQLFALER